MEKNVDYISGQTPVWYKCAECGSSGVKLWRPHLTQKQKLLCAGCAANDQFKKVEAIDEDGQWFSDFGLTDQIGIFVPAIPFGDRVGFWVYSFWSLEALGWWRSLPLKT